MCQLIIFMGMSKGIRRGSNRGRVGTYHLQGQHRNVPRSILKINIFTDTNTGYYALEKYKISQYTYLRLTSYRRGSSQNEPTYTLATSGVLRTLPSDHIKAPYTLNSDW